jgi:hypothetical protein
MTSGSIVLSLCSLLPAVAYGQTVGGTVAAGTPLAVKTTTPIAMKTGARVRGELLYPVYADNELVLPAGTPLVGSVVALRSDHKRRVNASLGGDFTPFKIPVVRFTGVLLPDGRTLPLSAGDATDGAPIYRAVSPAPTHGGFVGQEFHMGLTVVRSDIALFLAPGKGDRLRQFVYSQLPYHPQRVEAGTAWTIETTAAMDVPAEQAGAKATAPERKARFWEVQKEEEAPALNEDKSTWMIEAYLAAPLSSEISKQGQPIKAVVAQPVYNADHTIAVPQGATLVGTVTRAKPSRTFGRTGVLSFNFQQLLLPESETPQTVETRLTGADSAANIALNSEGQAKSKPQDKVAVPLLLALMAARPLDQEHGGANQVGKNGVGGSAGLGLVGTIVGLAGGSPYAAAGIGYWGAARATYSRWIGHGQTITFAKNTRIVVETTPRRSTPMRPAGAEPVQR